jgi:D-alanyl-D-alanine carboxypeptidase
MLPRSRRRAGLAATALLATTLVAAPQAFAASGRDAKLTASIEKALKTADAPGAIVGVWQHGRAPYTKAFGVRDTKTKRPMRTSFYSRIGSVTKTFTVTAILQLADQGKVSLDDPIAKYVDGVISGDVITLRQLTNMTSGIPNYTVIKAFNDALVANPFKTWTTQELLGLATGGPLDFAPGTSFTYSNTNTILLGQVVQNVTGEPIGQYIERHIVAPLGLKGTSYPEGSAFPRPHADGYGNDRGRVENVTRWNPTWTGAAGQMVSTLQDMRVWAQRLSTGRGLYSPAIARERAASVAGNPKAPIAYGIGMFNVSQWRGHNGSLPGYQTLALYRPQSKTTVVAFINTDVEVKGKAPSTLLGEAITKVLSPKHVYDLPAAPGGEDE